MSATRHPTQEITRLLAELVAIPSVNPEGKETSCAGALYGEGRLADYLEHLLRSEGLPVERQTVLAGRENVLCRIPAAARPGAEPLLLEAHMDTVDVEGMVAPFTPRLEGGRLHGRGACDTKASLAAMVTAFRRVAAARRAALRRDLWLLASADEEFGQTGIRRLVASGLLPAAAVVGEPTSLAVVTAHKGQIYVRLAARGRAAHTSVPEQGQNAIYAMAEVVRVLERRAAAGDLGRPHSLCGPPLLSVSVISGGVSEHIVPDHCQIAVDLRSVPGQTTTAVLQQISDWLDEELPPALRSRISLEPPHHDAPPMETPVAHPLVQGLARVAEKVLGRAEVGGVPFNTDGGVLAEAGVPVVVFGPGDIAQAHSPGEFVEVSQAVAAAEILEGFLAEAAT